MGALRARGLAQSPACRRDKAREVMKTNAGFVMEEVVEVPGFEP